MKFIAKINGRNPAPLVFRIELMPDVLQCMGGKMQCKTDVTVTDETIQYIDGEGKSRRQTMMPDRQTDPTVPRRS